MRPWIAPILGLGLVVLAAGCGAPDAGAPGDNGGDPTSNAIALTVMPAWTAAAEPTPEHYLSTSLEGGVLSWLPWPPGARYHVTTPGEFQLIHEREGSGCRPVMERRNLEIDAVVDAPKTEYRFDLPALPADEHWFFAGTIQIDVLDAAGSVMYSAGYWSSGPEYFC